MVVPTAIAGAWSHSKLGQVERSVVLPAAVASVVTGAAFASIAHLLPGSTLRTAFAIVLGITNAGAESLNAKVQWIKDTACGFRNRERFRNAIYFHCGKLDLYPARLRPTHTNS